MKKLLAILLAAVMVLALVACGAAPEAPASAPAENTPTEVAAPETDYSKTLANAKIVVGVTDFAPMDYRDENGAWTGFDAELAEAVFKKLGFPSVELVEIDWDNKILELNAGSIDCVWNGMTLTDEVLNSMECTKPYVLNAQVVVMKAENVKGDETDESIAGLTFAVEAGSAGALTAGDFGYENLTEVAAQSNALMEVAAGTSDACIIDLTMANAMTGAGTSYEDLVVAVELTNEEYGIGFRKGSDMAGMVNAILAEMTADGSLQKLADKYGLSLVG